MISRKRKTITGRKASGDVPVSIKPTRARRIIRRFHLLINKRRIVCNKLGISLMDNDEGANTRTIDESLNPRMKHHYQIGASETDRDMESQLLKAQSLQTREQLIRCLGYIMNQIHSGGGLRDYQLASRVGQESNRGGDSSKILVKWLRELGHKAKNSMSALEIGSLSTKNQISTCGIFHPLIRIDLQSTLPGIERQDFMQKPLPTGENEKFDLISCSLVLNFVPTPAQRGQMCLRFKEFLKDNGFLFIVLPLPCINHSRYMNRDHFEQLMRSLGYSMLLYHEAKKLCYMLLSLNPESKKSPNANTFSKKRKLYDRPGLNNFCILL